MRPPPTRSRSLLRPLLRAVVALVLLVVAASVAAYLLIDPNSFRPRIEQAVQRATGRALVLRGPLRLGLGLPPTLVANDVGLANMAGGSRPEMATVARLSASVALLPLLRGEIDLVRLDLTRPDLLLETDAAGHANWQFAPPPNTNVTPAPASPAPPPARITPAYIAIGTVHVTDGTIAWRDGGSGRSATVKLPMLDLAASGGSMLVSGDLVSNGRPLKLSGETGSLAGLLGGAPPSPWPVQLVVQGEGSRLAVRGAIAAPRQGAGYALQVDAAMSDLTPFAPLLPALPPLHDVTLAARLVDAGGGVPAISGLAVHVAGLALPGGAAISVADLAAPDLHAPARVDVRATLHGVPVHVAGTLGALAALRPGAPPAAIDLSIEAAGSQATLQGTLANLTTRPALHGTLTAPHLDLDTLLAALTPPPAPPAAGAPEPPAPAGPKLVFSERPFDLAGLRAADLDLTLAIAALQAGGASYSDVAGHLVLQDGRLTLDPFAGQSPGGRLDGRLSIDATTATPPMALLLQAPALALKPFATALGVAGVVGGNAAVYADLHASGQSPHALAATLSGRLNLDVTDAEVDNALLAATLGGVLRAAKLPASLLGEGAGQTRLRCLVLHVEAKDGTAQVTSLLADTGRVQVQGGGSVQLGTETLDLNLRPLVRIGPGLVVPVHLGGTLLAPKPVLGQGGGGIGAGGGEGCGPGEPAAAAAPGAPPAAKPKPPKPIDILRGLLAH